MINLHLMQLERFVFSSSLGRANIITRWDVWGDDDDDSMRTNKELTEADHLE